LKRTPATRSPTLAWLDCYSILAVYSILTSKEAFARAKAAAVAAVAFDEELAEGHTSLGFIKAFLDWDWPGGEKEFERAIELNPRYWVTRYWYAITLTSCGRFEEAERQIRHGIELEPLSPVVIHGAAWTSYASGRYTEVVERTSKGLEIDPTYFLLRMWLGVAYEAQGAFPEAIHELQQAVDLGGRGVSWVLGALGHVYAVAGQRPEALKVLEELLDRAKQDVIDFISVSLIYAGLGDTDSALTSLEKACEARGMSGVLVKVDPRLNPLRSEPRFQQVLRRMNLA
jgi:tetratricopeptide (TPR) repeat protein